VELVEATERIDLLEKRIDEEVRRRMELEARASRLQEDLKVVHDRMRRLARRGEPPQ
jgi:ATP-dependent Lon protease